MKEKRGCIRQGDVLLEPISRMPKGRHVLVPRDKGVVVLAYGEVTGHAHGLVAEGVQLFECPDAWQNDMPDDRRVLTVDRPTYFQHGDLGEGVIFQAADHGVHLVPPGKYRVRPQGEYTPQGIVRQGD